MDKNKIKTFAVWARRALIAAVSEKAARLGITETKIEEAESVQGGFRLKGKEGIFSLPLKDREALVSQVRNKGFKQVMEEAAYTWFNRFMGLRYMEINDYLPTGVRILSSEVEGKAEPDVITRVSEVIDQLHLDSEYVYLLIDSGTNENREKLYKYILVKQCNELGRIIPQMFEKISDYTELLLPDNLLEENSVIRRMVSDIAEEDFKEEVEIIGWMYQYYISEKKDEVFAALKDNVKITKENIPAATQLFTPKWIVKYMVENSLGRLWLEGHPNKELQTGFKYYLEEAEQEPEVEEELKKIREEHSKLTPEDIKVLDPCMGSGHILVYAFDVLYKIYKTAGYPERDIPRKILENNLYGLDIDDRAAQLAAFALIMKARHYNRRLFREIEREHIELNLCSIQESNGFPEEAVEYLVSTKDTEIEKALQRQDVEYLIDVFNDAKEYGSILEVKKINFEAIEKKLVEIRIGETSDMFELQYKKVILERISQLVKQAKIMSEKYEVCVTNPPYMGRKGMSDKLSKFVDDNYKDSSIDIFACFIEKGFRFCKANRFNVLVTMQSWMFLSSFYDLRIKLMQNSTITTLLHMDNMVMGIAFGTSSTVFRKVSLNKFVAKYKKIDYSDINKQTQEPYQFKLLDKRGFLNKQENFKALNSNQIAYWMNESIFKIFQDSKKIKDYGNACKGIDTGDNNRFLKMWYEVELHAIGLNFKRYEDAISSNYKYYPYNKGGSFRKWYGNNEYVLYWESQGLKLKQFSKSNLRNKQFYMKKGITWSTVTSGNFSARSFGFGYFFDNGGSCLFTDELEYFCSFLNSKTFAFFQQLNPTINYQPGDIASVPVINLDLNKDKIVYLSNRCVMLSREDWDSFETSWDFKTHPLIKSLDKGTSTKLSSVFNNWESVTEESFKQLKHNEEELNRIFIDIYGLQEELTPEVEDKDITIRKADRERDIKSLISYAVGCILGRYSINADGLIYAGGDINDKWNIEEGKVRKLQKDDVGNIISDTWVKATFLPDADNVIPITDEEYFEDDLVAKFIDFIRTVYSQETLEENLDYIADSIGRKASETARQAIRRYFLKDFYSDHLKIYQKRPIYWLFDSGKADGFKALVYMHRYNEATVAKVRTDYLHVLQRKYEAEIVRLHQISDSEEYSTKERTAAKKKIEKLSKMIEECREYDQIVAHLANEKISIDLDDGVKVNYAKFQGIKVINSKGKEVKMDLLGKI